MIHDVKKTPQSKEIDDMLTLYLNLIDFYEKLDLNKDSDNQKVSSFLKETNVLSSLQETYFPLINFSSINLLMNKIFNRVDPFIKKAFLDFYSISLKEKSCFRRRYFRKHSNVLFLFLFSNVWKRSYISEEEAERRTLHKKDAIQLTKKH